MKKMRSIIAASALSVVLAGCSGKDRRYGTESQTWFPGPARQVWAVAPAVNLSGQTVDPLIQADDLYQQLQQVHGLTVIPVNRVAEVYAALHIARVQSAEQASLVCEQLGCDALIVPTITIFDPYDPPKLGASLQVLKKGATSLPPNVDIHELSREAAPPPQAPLPPPREAAFKQSVGMFDAANGTVRERLVGYASGRNDPVGPLGNREYLLNMDRYSGFVYHELILDLLRSMNSKEEMHRT
ncbi:MAG TPA: hypothetical protein VLJ39_20130 [Tepidisphaeraceae bacterium]|jgi:hypothetical protein|nr:hypothetical protein [Tepidisphaeraceae bacterium]